ncbi:hypothetical protein ACQEVC_34445 [Plantactinospora sp. CA-294935]|uniref:hypothetical protein n=1 Tax=Plantactinospora sp. CA-294935 TaxID=3240012 RepID=UPI003D926759
MSREDAVHADAIRRLRTQVPTFFSTRDTATHAVAATAAEIGLELRPADVRALALAVVDAIEKGSELRGVEFAYGLVDREVNETYQDLIAPATAAAAVDPAYSAVLAAHQQYVSGMARLRKRLGDSLLYIGRKWLGDTHPVVEAPPVVALNAPAGAAEARERVAVRAGSA